MVVEAVEAVEAVEEDEAVVVVVVVAVEMEEEVVVEEVEVEEVVAVAVVAVVVAVVMAVGGRREGSAEGGADGDEGRRARRMTGAPVNVRPTIPITQPFVPDSHRAAIQSLFPSLRRRPVTANPRFWRARARRAGKRVCAPLQLHSARARSSSSSSSCSRGRRMELWLHRPLPSSDRIAPGQSADGWQALGLRPLARDSQGQLSNSNCGQGRVRPSNCNRATEQLRLTKTCAGNSCDCTWRMRELQLQRHA